MKKRSKTYYPQYIFKKNNRRETNNSYILKLFLIIGIIFFIVQVVTMYKNKPSDLLWWDYFLYLDNLNLRFIITIAWVVSLLSVILDDSESVQKNIGNWIHKFVQYTFLVIIPFLIFDWERKQKDLDSIKYLSDTFIIQHIDKYDTIINTFRDEPTFVNLYNLSVTLLSIQNKMFYIYISYQGKPHQEYINKFYNLLNRHMKFANTMLLSDENKEGTLDTIIKNKEDVQKINDLNYNIYMLLQFLPYLLNNTYLFQQMIDNHEDNLKVLENKYQIEGKEAIFLEDPT